MEVADTLGGIPALTAAVVVCVGLLGSIVGIKTLKLTRIKSPIAQGLSLGAAAHAVGTSTAMDISSKYGAYASLGLTLNGIFTALLTDVYKRQVQTHHATSFPVPKSKATLSKSPSFLLTVLWHLPK